MINLIAVLISTVILLSAVFYDLRVLLDYRLRFSQSTASLVGKNVIAVAIAIGLNVIPFDRMFGPESSKTMALIDVFLSQTIVQVSVWLALPALVLLCVGKMLSMSHRSTGFNNTLRGTQATALAQTERAEREAAAAKEAANTAARREQLRLDIDHLREELGRIESDPLESLELSALFAPNPDGVIKRFWDNWLALSAYNLDDDKSARELFTRTDTAFELAKAEAQNIGFDYLDPVKARQARRAQGLLKMGLSSTATPAEAHLALSAAARILAELNLAHLPQAGRKALSDKIADLPKLDGRRSAT